MVPVGRTVRSKIVLYAASAEPGSGAIGLDINFYSADAGSYG